MKRFMFVEKKKRPFKKNLLLFAQYLSIFSLVMFILLLLLNLFYYYVGDLLLLGW